MLLKVVFFYVVKYRWWVRVHQLWLQFCEIHSRERQFILEPHTAVDCIDRALRPKCTKQPNGSCINSCLIRHLFFGHRICELLVLVFDVVTCYSRQTHLASTQIQNIGLMVICPDNYLKLTLSLQFILKKVLKGTFLFRRAAALIRWHRDLKVKNLIDILPLKMPCILTEPSPIDLNPGLYIATIIDVSKHIGFIDLNTEVLFPKSQQLILTFLTPFWKAANADRALDDAGLGWLVQIFIVDDLVV